MSQIRGKSYSALADKGKQKIDQKTIRGNSKVGEGFLLLCRVSNVVNLDIVLLSVRAQL